MKEYTALGNLQNIAVMTEKKGVLTYEPLEREAFFGREGELAYLEKVVRQKKHVVVSGIGGIGKTELLRQLIRSTVESESIDELWMIPWSESIKASFLAVIRGERGENNEERFSEVLSYLRRNTDIRRLILIDNVEAEIAEDPMLEILTSLNDCIIMSSRLSSIEGFETYTLDSLSNAAGMQVFEYSYGKKLTAEDRLLVESFMERLFMRHTLSIGLVGRYMRRHKVPVAKLGEVGSKLRAYTLPQMYKNMYHVFGMSDEERAFLAFLARCPRDSYPLSFLMENYPRRGRSFKTFLNTIGNLADGGWITLDDDSVSVQPYIAENVIRLTSCPEEAEMFVRNVLFKWAAEEPRDERMYAYIDKMNEMYDQETVLLCNMVGVFCEKYLETLSKECFMSYVMTIYQNNGMPFVFAKPRRAHMYLKAENVGIQTEIFFKIRMMIKTKEQFDELDNLIRERQSELPVAARCSIFRYFMDVCSSYYAYGRTKYYSEYILANSKDKVQRLEALVTQEATYICMEDLASAERVIAELNSLETTDEHRLWILLAECNFYYLTGQYQKVYELVTEAEEIEKRTSVGMELSIRFEMAVSLRGLERYDEAERYFVDTLEYLDSVPELQDLVLVARFRQEYAILLEKMNRFEEAERYYKQSIEVSEGVAEESQVDISRNNLAVLYNRMGRGEDALAILDVLLKKAADRTGIFYMEVLNNHSIACEQLGRTEQALAETEESFELLLKNYGPEHRKSIEAKQRLKRISEQKN